MSLNCSERYRLNSTNLDPQSLFDRYPSPSMLNEFMPATLFIVRCLMLVWLTVGLFGNSLSFAVWVTKHQRRKSTSAIYLAALALTDLLLIFVLLNYHLERYWSVQVVTSIPYVCQAYQCLSIFSQYYSTTLVFGFTIERYIAVCFPFKRHKLCNHKRACLAVFILFLIALIPMSFQAVLWTYEDGICMMKTEWVRDSRIQAILLAQEIIFSLIVPFAALVFNILVLKEMKRIIQATAMPSALQKKRRESFSIKEKLRRLSTYNTNSTYSDQNQLNEPKNKESSSFVSTTIMLVILSFYLIACAMPPGIMYLAQFTWAEPDDCLSDDVVRTDPGWKVFFNWIRTKELIDVLCASHYALNFFIYMLTYKGFREHVGWILRCKIDKLRSLSSASARNYVFPRRTGPRMLRAGLTNRSEEYSNLVGNNDRQFVNNHHVTVSQP